LAHMVDDKIIEAPRVMSSHGDRWSEHIGIGRVAFDVAGKASRPMLVGKEF
jgi:hypothetical protein